ncbi:MAG: hypothetical protein A3K67_04665 [Euryarchaeota archaeon RBG_16_62_10]|nr:MAG: hypothetical protein A3K67_04665 [Euryarchaeota archaeon RBG_16_62_10]
MFPVDAQVTTFIPSSFAFVMPTVMPLSLKDPVGFVPSNLTKSDLRPSCSASLRHRMRGVPPSESEYSSALSPTGISSLYFQTERGRFDQSLLIRRSRASAASMRASRRFPQDEHA